MPLNSRRAFLLAAAVAPLAPLLIRTRPAGALGLGDLLKGANGLASEATQLMVHAEALTRTAKQIEQINNQLRMLEGVSLNNAGSLFSTITRAQGLLGQLQGVVYSVDGTVGMIEETWPSSYGAGTTLQELVARARTWRTVERNAIAESQRLQSALVSGVVADAERDRLILNASAAAPGVRGAIQAGNQLTGSLIGEIRQLRLASVAHARAVEAQMLGESAEDARSDAGWCRDMRDMPGGGGERCR